MGIQKQYLKSKPVCEVALNVPKSGAMVTHKAPFRATSTIGRPRTLVKRLKADVFSATVGLGCDGSCQSRYLLGQPHWKNEFYTDGNIHADSQIAYIR
jgi:hypothetical protein